jgi:hypothetical protein
MKSAISMLFFALSLTAVAAAADRWPACAPVLSFTASDIGVASYEVTESTRPEGAWVCLLVNRQTQKVRTAAKEEFESLFPGALAAANRPPGACQEMLLPPPPDATPQTGQPACVSPKVFCEGAEITVRVSQEVAKLPCPSRLFSAATLIDDRLWAGIAPLDPYRREYPGAGLIVQVLDGSVASRLTPKDVGGRQVCAIRKDPFSTSVWGTTENGLVEFTPSGKVKRILQMRTLQRPTTSAPAKAPAKAAPKKR